MQVRKIFKLHQEVLLQVCHHNFRCPSPLSDIVAQEFIPTWKDKPAALRHAAMVCDV